MSTYHNPFWHHNFPDPFILKVRGRYYAYATEANPEPEAGTLVFPILSSDDLVHWRAVGHAMPALGTPYHHYWAPEVSFQQGRFFLYYAVHRETEFNGGIRVAVAEQPEGPFLDSGHDLTGSLLPWAIDPHVLRDDDGQNYLYMTIDYWHDPNGLAGSGNAVARLRDPFTLEGPITRVTPPAHHWQLFEARRPEKGGVDWYTVEGPALLKHRGRYYEMFSGGCYYRDNYALSYAISSTPMGPDGMRDASWQDWAGPRGTDPEAVLVRGDGQHLISPGHNSLVLGPNNVDLYLAYHAQLIGSTERFPCLDRLFWHGEDLWTPAPMHEEQPAPALPRLRELFQQSALSSHWQPATGTWQVADQAVRQQEGSTTLARLRAQVPLKDAWLLEVHLRYEDGEGSYGLFFQDQNQRESLRVALTPDAHLTITTVHAPDQPLLQTPQIKHLNPRGWHQLLLALNGSMLEVYLDGLPTGSLLLPPELTPLTSFALYTASCQAAFSGVTLTDHFHDLFLRDVETPALLGWQASQASHSWQIAQGLLTQADDQGTHVLLKNLILNAFEQSVTLRLPTSTVNTDAACGFLLWASNQRFWHVSYMYQQSGWTLGLYEWHEGDARALGTLSLGADFEPERWHTLRLRCADGSLVVWEDGAERWRLKFAEQPLRAGLRTHQTRAEFLDVWQTGLSKPGH